MKGAAGVPFSLQFHDSSPIRFVRLTRAHSTTRAWSTVPGQRGRASVFALVFAVAILLGAGWLGFGDRDPQADRGLALREDARNAGPPGPAASVLRGEADALLHEWKRKKGTGTRTVRFAMEEKLPPETEPPDVRALEGHVEGSTVVLTWKAAGGEATRYVVELVGDDSKPLRSTTLPPGALRFADGPVDALAGTRTYRVLAYGRDGTVAGRTQKVPFRMDFDLEFLGADAAGRGRFRVIWDRDGERVAGEFAVPVDEEIGGSISAAEGHPALDLGTGWTFAGIAGRRTVVPGEVEVPRFSPNGVLRKDPETGKVVFEKREGPKTTVQAGAEVAPGDDGDGRILWFPETKD